jgi:hypothetical protein
MERDNELEAWRLEWQTENFVPPDLRKRIERDIRRHRLSFWASVAVTILMGGSTTLWALVSGESSAVMVVAAVWLFIGITWATSIQLERMRGSSKPLAETTAAFLEFAIHSCRVRRQGIAAAAALYAGFFSFMVAWKYRQLAAEMPLDVGTYLTSGRMMTQCAITAVLAVIALVRRRRLNRELHHLMTLRQRLG